MKAIVLHLRLVKGLRGVPLSYVIRQHVKAVYVSPGYSAYLNLHKEMISRAPIINAT